MQKRAILNYSFKGALNRGLAPRRAVFIIARADFYSICALRLKQLFWKYPSIE